VETVQATGSDCTSNNCATSTELIVRLSAGAKVARVHYFTNASGNPALDEPNVREITPGDVGWSFMAPASIAQEAGGETVVKTTYFNRSSNRARQAKITVDYNK
jgi:hypothetical protein